MQVASRDLQLVTSTQTQFSNVDVFWLKNWFVSRWLAVVDKAAFDLVIGPEVDCSTRV